jgi:hypothetical protein
MTKEQKFKVGGLVIDPNQAGNQVVKVTEVLGLDPNPIKDSNLANWTRLKIVRSDGTTGTINDATKAIPTSVEEQEKMLEEAKKLSQEQP